MTDLRRAIRRLAVTPGFTATVIGVLALAIGVNASLFSVAQAVRFGPLPYPDSDRLFVVNETQMSAGLDELMTSVPNFRDWVAEADVFEVLAASNGQGTLVYTEGREPVRLRANVVSSSYLSLLGAELTMGRYLLPEEDEGWNEHPVVVLSHGLWQRAFGGEENIVGRGVTLGERPYTVVGVLAPGFHDIDSATHETDAWVPISMGPHVLELRPASNLRGTRWLRAFGRLRPGVSHEAARTQMETLANRMAEAYPDTNGGHGARIRPLAELLMGDIRGAILALAGAALFVLLIGCANVANLLLVRAAARRRNYAVKRALGVTRAALLRETLSEGLVLSLSGGLVGVVMALIVNARLADWLPVALPAFVDLRLDLGALAAAVALSLATGIAFALLPALEFGRDNLNDVLQEGSRGDTGGVRRGRLMRPLVVVELAAAVVLMVGSLLMVRSFEVLHDTSLGFETNDLLTLKLDLEGSRFDDSDTSSQFGERLIEACSRVPGIETATVWGPRIPGAATWYTALLPYGHVGDEMTEATIARRHHVSPGALTNLAIPLVAGRDFSHDDRSGHPAVVIVSESLAGSLWPGEEPIGRQLIRRRPPDPNEQHVFEVVGVARDVKHSGRRRPVDNPRDVYFSYLQVPRQELVLLLRTSRPTDVLMPLVRDAVRTLDPTLPLYDFAMMEQRMADDEKSTRFVAGLMTLYAALAALLAGLGVYGVITQTVKQRTKELGVRIAMGATRFDLLTLVGRQTLGLVATGLALGLLGATALSGVLQGMLFGVPSRDPVTLACVVVLLALAGMLAGLRPALRVTRLDPVEALRDGGS